MSEIEEIADQIVGAGFRNPDGPHNQPPFQVWTNKHLPFIARIRCRTGVNCLGGLTMMEGQWTAPTSLVEAIVSRLNKTIVGIPTIPPSE